MIAGNLESLEKVFFAYILENPTYFHRVEPVSFNNPNIQFIYIRVRNYYTRAKSKPNVPSNKVIYELVRLDDPNHKISDEFIKMLLTVDIAEYSNGKDDDWLSKTIQAWCTHSNIFSRISLAAEKIRGINPLDHESVTSAYETIRNMVADASLISYGDDDLGLDFDDAESHIQDTKNNKLSTGWTSLNELMNGGWDRKTLNVIIGPSNSGKSLWLSNIAANTANSGKNVLYVSLEMSDRKVMKRIGAVRLRININEYDQKSKDVHFIQSKLREMRGRGTSFATQDDAKSTSGDFFEQPVGKLYVKEFPAGSATVADVEAHVKNLQEKKGIKLDMIIVDYLTIMAPDNRVQGTLFTNGKQLSEGLRAIGQKHDLAMVTAMQVSKDNFGASDITLADISESKAIVETADVMFGIIRTDEMRKQGKYILKLLKLRDGDFKWEKTHFQLNKEFLCLEGDVKLD